MSTSTFPCYADLLSHSDYTVLLVEDDEPLREVLALYMRDCGLTIHTATNGREALRHLEQHAVALVITDIMMPETDGIELVMALRKRWPEVRIIVISGECSHDQFGLLTMARRLGAHETLEKPVAPPRLLEVVLATLEEIALDE